MSQLLELFQRRRSVRRYAPRAVEREKIERCLEAARLAPSACNSQPWRFVAVVTPALRERLAEAAFSGAYRMNRFAAEAPVLVAMIREKSIYAARLGGTLRGVPYSLIDIGIAGEHLALQAEEEGLGCCWLGWFNERAVRRVLDLPKRTQIDILFSLGYAREDEPAREKQRKPTGDICEFR